MLNRFGSLWKLDGSWQGILPVVDYDPDVYYKIFQMNATTTRKVGHEGTRGPGYNWFYRPWTTIDGGAPLFLPMPDGVNGFAIDVNTCGTILGEIWDPNDVHQPAKSAADTDDVPGRFTERVVLWTKRVCDVLPILTH